MLSPDDKYPIPSISHGLVFLKACIKNPNIEVGNYTYYDGGMNQHSFESENVNFGITSKLIIGKFCQIARGAKFILSDANHQMSGFSTYPFFVFGKNAKGCPEWGNYQPDYPDKGPTTVGNDVWLGHESLMMPGVTIGDGVIVGSRAVVTKNVPPYSIVVGNPGRIVRQRFSDEVIQELLEIQWWNWDYAKISRNIALIIGADIKKLREAQ